MTFKTVARAGSMALAPGVLFGLFLGVTSINSSFAQAPAEAEPAATASTPVCVANSDAKLAVTEKCTPNSGDTAWMLTSMALVLMMTIPGRGLFLAVHGEVVQ